jgi:hypothetical protein
MNLETGVVVSIALFIVGLVFAAGRSFEQINHLRRELEKLDSTMVRELGEVKRILYTTVGGRRAIRPIEGAEESTGSEPT